MRVLMAYGTKRGGTEGLARAVGQGLEDAGHVVDVLPAQRIESLDRWEAVVVGGALYAWFWQRDARRFVKRHVEELQQLPVFFFSSGPLDFSARDSELPPPGSVARLAKLVGAQRNKTFGGRLRAEADAPGSASRPEESLHAGWGCGVRQECRSCCSSSLASRCCSGCTAALSSSRCRGVTES